MAKVADIGGKRLLGLAPDTWAKWVTQRCDVIALEILGSEFQWVSRENDVLMKAKSSTHGEFLILTELQLRYTNHMPLRMRAYVGLAEETYRLPIYPVLVNILPPSPKTTISDRFESNFLGIQARQDYRVINLWEIDAELVFEQLLDPLLPFVPILKNGGNQQTVRRALIRLQQNEQLVELESLLGFFASFVLETELVQQIMRWDMTVLRESPWYIELQREGEQRGLELGKAEGKAEGKVEGKVEEAKLLILRQLTRKLGALTADIETQVKSLDLPQLETLGEALLDFAHLSDLGNWLKNNS
jgi:predicted transposase YdaD